MMRDIISTKTFAKAVWMGWSADQKIIDKLQKIVKVQDLQGLNSGRATGWYLAPGASDKTYIVLADRVIRCGADNDSETWLLQAKAPVTDAQILEFFEERRAEEKAEAQAKKHSKINQKWKEYNDGMNEGGEGYNPYPKYI